MSESLDFNPALPESRQFTPPAEGGNVNIHNYGGNQVEAQRDGDDWNIFIKRAKREIAGDLASGNGDITRALTNGYGLRRVPR